MTRRFWWCTAPPVLAVMSVVLGAGCNKNADAPAPAASPGPYPATAAGPTPSSPGEAVFQTHCSKCHTTTGPAPVSELPKGKTEKLDLAGLGADPAHTREWLVAFVKDPRSQRPGARMPKFGGKIGDDDLEKLADYLLSLK